MESLGLKRSDVSVKGPLFKGFQRGLRFKGSFVGLIGFRGSFIGFIGFD